MNKSNKRQMHLRNIFRTPPDYTALAIKYEQFRRVCKLELTGKVSIDYKNEDALRALTQMLLQEYFQLDVKFAPGSLVPTLPLRLNYILWIEDLLGGAAKLDEQVHGIDIGCGSSCIYTLLAAQKNSWRMSALESNAANLEYAQENIKTNKLDNLVKIIPQIDKNIVFRNFFETNTSEIFHFCLCNPPFYDSSLPDPFHGNTRNLSKRAPPHNCHTGHNDELACVGGEVQFVQRIIDESLLYPHRIRTKNRNDHSTSVNATSEVIYASPSTSVVQQQTATTTTITPNSSASSGSTNSSVSGGGGGSSRKKSNNSNHNQQNNNGVPKRYACTHCPYSTDRRDLYTRHENIHKEEKPFQCYACLKQFNRADHVKKHFLRMHRELQYDINKTRRHTSNHSGGRGNVTITTLNHTSNTSNSDGSPEQKPNIFHAANVQIDNAFLEAQRQPTSSSMSIVETIEAVASAADTPLPQMKQEKCDDGSNNGVGGNGGANGGNIKPKREKRFTCCYCPWSGADKWGLKRHLNTHTKPFVCLLCDYKAARSERLATHVLKVHNKRACNKCSFLADTQEEFQTHINEVHPHDNRSSRNSNSSNTNATNNLNVLRTIGNTLVTNNQFQNTGTTFGVGNNTTTTTNAVGNAGGSVTIYTTTTTNDNGSGGITGGPLQEIIVNPTTMVGWRLSANGSLIPPHDLLTGALPTAAVQKRGSERLFQYLEADGSDPEDYARLLKMDAISRNTASVAQDFHKAGGVHELKIPANHQLLFNNKLHATSSSSSQWTTKEAAALLQSLSNTNFVYQHQRLQHNGKRQRQHSTGEDDENTPSSSASSMTSSDGISPMKKLHNSDRKRHKLQNVAATSEQRKAMSTFLSNNFDLHERKQIMQHLTNDIECSKLKNEFQQLQKHLDDDCYDDDDDHYHHNENQENQVQLIKSSPAYKNTKTTPTTTTNINTNTNTKNIKCNNYKNQIKIRSPTKINASINTTNSSNNVNSKNNHQHLERERDRELHRIDLIRDNKENTNADVAATFLTSMEYQNLNKIGTQFQNYVKDIINKYYAETPLLFPAMPTATTTPQQSQQLQQQQQLELQQLQQTEKLLQRKRMLSETEEYIEYLRNKEDITLTITPKVSATVAETTTATSVIALAKQHSTTESVVNVGSGNNRRSTCNGNIPSKQHQQSPLKRYQDLTILKRPSNRKPQISMEDQQQLHSSSNINNAGNITKPRKTLSQLATLLPLLADAASQQQYLATSTSTTPTPLDFSKKPTQNHCDDNGNVSFSIIPARTPNPSIASITTSNVSASAAAAAAATAAMNDKRSSRKQAQPKKIRTPPEVVIAMLRDKYLNRMVDRKLSCSICARNQRSAMLVFNYHTKGSLALHRLWKHIEPQCMCQTCNATFKHCYSLRVHCRCVHQENGGLKHRQRRVGGFVNGKISKRKFKKKLSSTLKRLNEHRKKA